MKQGAAIATRQASIFGDRPYEQRARQTLPILVRQARAEQPIFYADLAKEVGVPNPRNLASVLGTIGNSLITLSSEWKQTIPPIQALVCNKATALPGHGFAPFMANPQEFKKANSPKRRRMLDVVLSDIYDYPRWDEVLRHFRLSPTTTPVPAPTRTIPGGLGRPTGESAEHRDLKNFIAHHPAAIDLPPSLAPGEVEFQFGSGDAIDILFKGKREWIGVEVKSARSPQDDLMRGLYQCVKYQALIEATQRVDGHPLRFRTILAHEGPFSEALLPVKNVLSIETQQVQRLRGI